MAGDDTAGVSIRYPYLDHPGPIAFAHRGGALEAPENTMLAFQRVVDLGYRYLETDIQVTADGVLLAFHDKTLDRATDRTGVIAELPWSTVREARVAGTEPIPLLEEVLGSFPSARVNVDVKDERTIAPVVEAIQRCAAIDRMCVASFSGRRLRQVREALGPRLCTALGPAGIGLVKATGYGLRFLAPLVGAAAACVQVPVRFRGVPVADERFVAAAHRLGLEVHVWTIDDAAEMRHLLDMGADGVMTDRPTVLKEVLVGRGEWH
jgi:glycerophosphoryl diester phosphodiesterase